jgi:hypothetical protein
MIVGRPTFAALVRPILIDEICTKDPGIPLEIPPLIADLTGRMLKQDGNVRIMIEEIRQHPWIPGSVGSIYFEKSFHAIEITKKTDHKVSGFLQKNRFDPEKMLDESSEEALLRLFLQRRFLARMAARPELFMPGKQRHGFSLPAFPPYVEPSAEESPHPPTKVSLLDNVQC